MDSYTDDITPPSGQTDPGPNSTVIIPCVTVACIVITVAVAAVVYLVLRRKRNERKEINRRKRTPTQSSSTLRSGSSDHPYENPIVCDNDGDKQRGSNKDGNPYAGLAGQSLPHHYQGLGRQSNISITATDESPYDELMASTECSEYYFNIDQTAPDDRLRNIKNKQSSLNRDRPYNQIRISNTGNNAHEEDDDSTGYYFKVERPLEQNMSTDKNNDYLVIEQAGSDAKRHIEQNNFDDERSESVQTNDKKTAKPKETVPHSKPHIAAKPKFVANKAMVKNSRYDKLDRASQSCSRPQESTGHEYSKLLPSVAVDKSQTTPADGSYLTVQLTNTSSQNANGAAKDEQSDINDYNRLNRGVEKEIAKNALVR